jgi:hypothetical protein
MNFIIVNNESERSLHSVSMQVRHILNNELRHSVNPSNCAKRELHVFYPMKLIIFREMADYIKGN